ncbi:MAG: hypothetical protein MR910_08025 [Clostridiales bacterium]|nr:hypothetical protein [Clostridiales bacterium]
MGDNFVIDIGDVFPGLLFSGDTLVAVSREGDLNSILVSANGCLINGIPISGVVVGAVSDGELGSIVLAVLLVHINRSIQIGEGTTIQGDLCVKRVTADQDSVTGRCSRSVCVLKGYVVNVQSNSGRNSFYFGT